jgi:hypothetical protein
MEAFVEMPRAAGRIINYILACSRVREGTTQELLREKGRPDRSAFKKNSENLEDACDDYFFFFCFF